MKQENNFNKLETIFETDTSKICKYLYALTEFERQSKAFEKYLNGKVITSLPDFSEHRKLLANTMNILQYAKTFLRAERDKMFKSMVSHLPYNQLVSQVKNKICSLEPNVALTIRFNKDFKTDELNKIYSITKHILQKYQKYYGIHNKGLRGIGIIEGTGTSAHIHLAITNPLKSVVDTEDFYAIKTIAKLYVASSDVNIQSIYSVRGWARYMTKSFNNSNNFFMF